MPKGPAGASQYVITRPVHVCHACVMSDEPFVIYPYTLIVGDPECENCVSLANGCRHVLESEGYEVNDAACPECGSLPA